MIVRALAGALVGVVGALGPIAPVPDPWAAAAVPPLNPRILRLDNRTVDVPFAGEQFYAQSRRIEGASLDAGWSCSVDFGDETAPDGYWRAHPWEFTQPCAMYHTYPTPGRYTITMTVTDPDGDRAEAVRTVDVARRKVERVDGGVEGSPVVLTAPAAAERTLWSLTGRAADLCALSGTHTAQVTVRCADDGRFVLDYDRPTRADSGAYAVSFVNGAPAPRMRPVRLDPQGNRVRSPRIGTGDAMLWLVDAHDPSWAPYDADRDSHLGDDLACAFDFGDGATGVDSGRTFGGCVGDPTYRRAGTFHASVRVIDDSGASATAGSRVEVVRRDVFVRSAGRTPGGVHGRVGGSLTDGSLAGGMNLWLADGRHVVVPALDVLKVRQDHTVALRGVATVDGVSGWFVWASIFRDGAVGLSVQLDRGDPLGDWTIDTQVDLDRTDFETVYRAPEVS